VSARELDVLGARAWPPLEEVPIADWRLRFSAGVTKRANSVLPLGPTAASGIDEETLAGRIAAVERAYLERGLPPRFQVTASSWPAALGDALMRRGYLESDRTLVMTRALTNTPVIRLAPDLEIVAQTEPSEGWLNTWWAVDSRGGAAEREIARGILARITPACLFAECHDEQGIAAVALGVLDDTRLGLYCLATLPRARRKGYARALSAFRIEWAKARGATLAYLAVTETNEPSVQLYKSLGFEVRQRYSYFTLPAEGRRSASALR
jgi:N-acetylglutamate synthase